MRKFLLISLVFIVSASLFASEFLESFTKKESFIPDHVVLSNGNDMYSYGISRNDDDQLSYSFDLQVEAPLWHFKFDANGFTNRGWRDGWDVRNPNVRYTPGASVIRGRYDSLESVIGLKLRPVEDDFYVHIYPEVGFALVGDYGWEWGQNIIHRIANIHEVELPYDNDGAKHVFAMLNGRANVGYKLFRFPITSLIAEVEASTKNTLGYITENQVLARLSVSTKTHDILGVHFGYMYAASTGDVPSYTRDLYVRYVNGMRFGFTIDTGIVSLKYTSTMSSGYGYGYVGIDVMGFFRPKVWEHTDMYTRVANVSLYDRTMHYISVGIPAFGHFDVIAKNSNAGGDPISPKEEQTADLNKNERNKRDYSFTAFGLRYNFQSVANGNIAPYIELTAGIQIFKLYELRNQVDDDVMESMGWVYPSRMWDLKNYFGLVNLEAGVTVLPDNAVIFGDTSLQLDFFGGMNMVIGGEPAEIWFYRYFDKIWEGSYYPTDWGFKTRLFPYFGLGVKFGFDL